MVKGVFDENEQSDTEKEKAALLFFTRTGWNAMDGTLARCWRRCKLYAFPDSFFVTLISPLRGRQDDGSFSFLLCSAVNRHLGSSLSSSSYLFSTRSFVVRVIESWAVMNVLTMSLIFDYNRLCYAPAMCLEVVMNTQVNAIEIFARASHQSQKDVHISTQFASQRGLQQF